MGPFLSPDGNFRVDFEEFEMRMSHWVCNPRVTHIPSGEVLLDSFNSMDDGAPSIDDDGRLHLAMRAYPGSEPGTEIIYDPRDGTVTHIDGEKSVTAVHPTLIKYATRPCPPAHATPVDAPPAIQMVCPLLSSASAERASVAPDPAAIRVLPRWVGLIYPLIFVGVLPAIVVAGWVFSGTPLLSRLPRLVGAEIAEFVVGAVLIGAGFVFMLWFYRGRGQR